MTTAPLPAVTGEGVDLYWIPLGAGHHSVRFNGIAYEALTALTQRRARCDLYHSVLRIGLPGATYWVEMTPVPDRYGGRRGVVATGSVGMHSLGRFRLFRYEVRRWRDGIVPDLDYAVGDPVHVTDDVGAAQRVFEAVPLVPTLTWGRDEERTGDMWTCNSIIAWTLARAGIDTARLPLPSHARAPGWDAGQITAARAAGVPTSTAVALIGTGIVDPADL